MDLFTLAANLTMDAQSFSDGISAATGQASSFQTKFDNACSKAKKAFAAVVSVKAVKSLVTGLLNVSKETAAYGDNIDKMSQKLGLSSTAYQEWAYILEKNGTSIDSMGTAFRQITNNLDDVENASDSTKTAYSKLGLSMQDLSKMDTDSRFEAIVTAFQNMPDGAEKSALAMDVFGRSAQELMPLLNGSAEDVQALKDELDGMGGVMSPEEVANAAAYTDAMTRFEQTMTSIKNTVGAKFLPVLTDGLETLSTNLGRLNVAYQQGGLSGLIAEASSMAMEIEFPTWEDIKNGVQTAWDAASPVIANMLSAVLGIDTSAAETALDTFSGVAGGIADSVKGFLTFTVGILTGDKDTIVQGISDWWDGVSSAVGSLLAPFGISLPSSSDIKAQINTWWDSIRTTVKLTLGIGVSTPTLGGNNEGKGATDSLAAQAANNGQGSISYADIVSGRYAETKASGIEYVPSNGFAASLGAGEAVLTRTQAQDWRNRDISGSVSIDYSRMASAFASVISGMSVNIDGQSAGTILAPTIDRQLEKSLRG